MYCLYLDDERKPKTKKPWFVVRSYQAFCDMILVNGCPGLISFDHDLGEEKTGLDCMKFFINYCMDNDIDPESVDINVHSANPVGAENIKKLWAGFVAVSQMFQEA